MGVGREKLNSVKTVCNGKTLKHLKWNKCYLYDNKITSVSKKGMLGVL